VQGDSDRLIAGGGTGGSKSIMASGSAIIEASDRVIEKGKIIAAHMLEAGVADIEFARGRFTIAGTDRSLGIMELAGRLRSGEALPKELPQTLDVDHIFKAAPSAFPMAAISRRWKSIRRPGSRCRQLHHGQRFRHPGEPDARPGPIAWRHRAGHRPGADEATAYDDSGQLMTGFLHGLRDAARRRCALLQLHQPGHPDRDQSGRCQGLRRGRLRRLAALGDERDRRCAGPARRQTRRHARDPGRRSWPAVRPRCPPS
jgi:hypothetical protein